MAQGCLLSSTCRDSGRIFKKGSKVYIEGSLRTRQWEKEGQKHYSTEIVASEMQMLDSRGDMPSGGDGYNRSEMPSGGDGYGRSEMPDSGGPAPQAPGKSAFESPPPEDFDDDIPF